MGLCWKRGRIEIRFDARVIADDKVTVEVGSTKCQTFMRSLF